MPTIDSPPSTRVLRRAVFLLPFLCLLALPVQAQDADGDGLSDTFEDQIGSDSARADTDNDGDDDWQEYFRCRSPLSAADRGPHRCGLGSAPGAPPAERGVAWSENGPIAGMNCTRIVGGSDAAQWSDTYLCTRPFMGFRWSTTGPVAGMTCVVWQNQADAAWNGTSNQLCRTPDTGTPYNRFPQDVIFWTLSSPPPFGPSACTRITNANKGAGWNNVHFCFRDTTVTFDSATCTNCDSDDVANGPVLEIRESDMLGDVSPAAGSNITLAGQACTRIAGDPLRCRVPAAPFAQLGARHLLSDNNIWTVGFAFPAPRLDAVSPAAAVAPGTTLTLDGVRFGYGTPVVTVGGVPCAVRPPVRNTRIQCTVPVVPPGSAQVSVLVGGQLSNARSISVILPPPTIDTVAPQGAVPTAGGGVLRVTGTNLDIHPVSVTVDNVACPVSTPGATEWRCTIPPGQGRLVPVVVQVGAVRRDTTLDYDAPVIDLVEGQDGPTAGGTVVRLLGRNFGNGANFSAFIGGVTCTRTGSQTHVQAECLLPAGRGADVPVRVVVSGQASNERSYRYGAPVVSGVAGQGGATTGGSVVTLSGSNFGAIQTGVAATIGGRPCSVSPGSVSHTQLSCTLPPGQGGAEAVQVVVAGQSSNSDRTYAYAAPALASVTGTGGPTSGGTLLTLTGNHFGVDRAAFSAAIDGRACVVPADAPFSHTSTQCLLPPGEGAAAALRLVVGGQPSNALAYAYAPPRIDSVLGLDGPTAGGTEVTLVGVNFGLGGAGFSATVDGNPCTVAGGGAVTHTQVRCVLPAGQGAAVPVRTTVAGQASNIALYRYGAPRVDSVQGQDGPTAGGNLITVIGTNFGLGGAALTAFVGGNSCLIPPGTPTSHTQLQCTLPAGQGAAVPVQVSVLDRASNTVDYRYGAPRIDEVQGQDGPTTGGTLVTLVGANFGTGGAFSATIGGAPCAVGLGGSVTHTQVRCTLPAGQGAAAPIAVEVAGQAANLRTYRYGAPVATIAAGTRLGTAGGDLLEITGSNLGVSGTVTVAGAACDTLDHTHARIRCTAPAGSGVAQAVVVDIDGQQAVLQVAYRAPAISAASPVSGPTAGGGVLTLDGSDFGATVLARPRTVEVGGSECALLGASHTRITCTLPPGEGAGRALRVVVDGQASNLLSFSYAPPRLLDLSPGAMPVQGGLDLELVGNDLGIAPRVTIDAVPCPLVPGGVAHQRARCRAPARAAGAALVRVDVGGQVSNTLALDYDAAPVVVSLIKAGAGEGGVTSNRLGLGCDAECVEREGLVPSGATVQFTATALPGSRFMRWQGACTGTAPQCSFNAASDQNVIAVFEDVLFDSGFEDGEAP